MRNNEQVPTVEEYAAEIAATAPAPSSEQISTVRGLLDLS